MQPAKQDPTQGGKRSRLRSLHGEGGQLLHPDWGSQDTQSTRSLYKRQPRPVESKIARLLHLLYTRDSAGKLEAAYDKANIEALGRLNSRTHVLGVGGNKGGPGKSTTAISTGLILSEYPNCRAIVVEANPDYGTLRHTIGSDVNRATISDLLRDYDLVERGGYGVLQRYLTMYGRLAVLTGPSDEDEMTSMTPSDFDAVLKLVSKHFSIAIIDAGTSFTNRVTNWMFQAADTLILVVTEDIPTLEGAFKAVRYLTSTRYEQTYHDTMADLTVLGNPQELRKLTPINITVAANKIGDPAAVSLDWQKVCSQLEGIEVVQLPYSTELPRLLNSKRLTTDNTPVAYRRAVKRLLATSLTRIAQDSERGDQ